MQVTLARKLVAEGVGTALLVAAIVGSGIMAQSLAKDPAIVLLCNALATGGALIAILLMFGPVSGAQLNPVLTVLMAATRDITPRVAAGYIVVQLTGAIAGAMIANTMFGLEPISLSTTMRAGTPQLLSEAVATFGLVGVVIAVGRTRSAIAPLAVAAYITAAYWFTASTSFANPAVTVGRALSNSYAGIRPADVLGFVMAQAIGAMVGGILFTWLVPTVRVDGIDGPANSVHRSRDHQAKAAVTTAPPRVGATATGNAVSERDTRYTVALAASATPPATSPTIINVSARAPR